MIEVTARQLHEILSTLVLHLTNGTNAVHKNHVMKHFALLCGRPIHNIGMCKHQILSCRHAMRSISPVCFRVAARMELPARVAVDNIDGHSNPHILKLHEAFIRHVTLVPE